MSEIITIRMPGAERYITNDPRPIKSLEVIGNGYERFWDVGEGQCHQILVISEANSENYNDFWFLIYNKDGQMIRRVNSRFVVSVGYLPFDEPDND